MRAPAAGPVPGVQRWGAVIWPSFFSAGVATMVFFAIFDPVDLAHIAWVGVEIDRKTGYTVGFFLFWACTFASSLFTSILTRTPHPGAGAHGRGQG
jgi:hypothetical protein